MTEKEKVLVDIILTGAEDLELCPPNFGIATKCGPYHNCRDCWESALETFLSGPDK
jgi:hypothetical protein